MKKRLSKLSYKQRLTVLFLVFLVFFIFSAGIVIGFIVLVAAHDDGKRSPVFFSLDETNATYSIKKTEGDIPQSPNYWVVHNGDEVFVGNSKVPLDPYLGKKIRIHGSYAGRIGYEQCIVTTCHQLEGAMIDIDQVQILQ